MIINHNLNAMNAHRQMGINLGNTAKATEKLSSGLRINRAGDDAAGLAISEKMRAQVRGLNQASRNAQDGISLIQTAEGALTESHAILQRMRELAVQSANDTNVAVDRSEIQKEINQLSEELTRIADTTEFNTQNLLGGKFKAKFHIGANEGQDVDLSINAMDAKALKVAEDPKAEFGVSKKVESTGVQAQLGIADGSSYEIVKLDNATVKNDTGTETGYNYAIMDGNNYVGVSKDGQTWKMVLDANKNSDIAQIDINKASDFDLGIAVTSGKLSVSGATDGNSAVTVAGTAKVDFAADVEPLKAGEYTVVNKGGLKLQNSAGNVVAESTDGADWKVDGKTVLTTTTLVADDKLKVASGGIDVSSQAKASSAITTINDALQTVSSERSMLGAMQNRLEHTIANLDTSSENLQASESRIRDVDMAKEMMNFSKNNILQQAAQAMLAQANQAPQGVLQLLR